MLVFGVFREEYRPHFLGLTDCKNRLVQVHLYFIPLVIAMPCKDPKKLKRFHPIVESKVWLVFLKSSQSHSGFKNKHVTVVNTKIASKAVVHILLRYRNS